MTLAAPSTSYAGIGKETTRGTAVAGAHWIPVIDPAWNPKVNWISDEGMRGSPVDTYNQIAGVTHSEWTAKTSMFPDTFPAYVGAILGGADTVTGTAAPYVHSIPILATGDTQSPSFTILAYDGQTTKRMTGSELGKLEISWAADGSTEVSMDWITNVATVVSNPTASYTTQKLAPGWDTSVTLLNGTTPISSTNSTGTITIDRKAASIYVAGTQGPYQNWQDKISVTGKLTFVAESTDTTVTAGLTQAVYPLVVRFIDPVTSYYCQFTMTTVQLQDPVPDQGKQWLEIDTNFVASANTTDVAGGAFSPVKFAASNAASSAYQS